MTTSWRIKFTLGGFLLFAALILVRLFYWQVIASDDLARAASRQHLSYFEIPARRGQILAADGFPLVASEEVFLLYAAPSDFKNSPSFLANKLSSLLVEADCEAETVASASADCSLESEVAAKESRVKEKLSRSDLAWVPIQRKISREVKDKIAALELAGIGFETESKRIYPEGTASAYLTGFVGSDEQGKDKGYFGLEGQYELELRGYPGLVRREKDASGKPILMGSSYKEEKKDGRDLLTTIDRTVQFILEKNLEKALEKYEAVSGSVVVMEPNTGAILGMVALPTYNPAFYYLFEENIFANPVVSFSYEPGSTFKVLVMAAAIDAGEVKPSTKCDQCAGPRVISDYTINTWDDQYRPNQTMTEVIVHSDNVGMVFVGEKLGAEKLTDYLDRFGIGQLTGIDLEEEDTPWLRPKKDWKKIDVATASFGQGIAVTPIQMVRAVGVLANEGQLVRPYLVKGIIDHGQLTEIEPRAGKRVIKSQTAKLLSQMMLEAVEKGEAKWAAPEGFKIAGKTGTAQIPVAGHYDEEKTIASFVGFAPVGKPRFVMLVTLREPASSPWGSETAAPLWFNIAEELFTYYGIMPG